MIDPYKNKNRVIEFLDFFFYGCFWLDMSCDT